LENTKLETSWWSKIKWLVSVYRDLKKNTSPRTVAGTRIIIASIAGVPLLGLIVTLTLPPNYYIGGVDITNGGISTEAAVLSILGFLLGSFLIYFDIRSELNQARKVARVIISGLPGMPAHFPPEVLSKSEQRLAREPIELSVQDDNTEKQVRRYNAEVCVELFKRFVFHHQCEKLYIGGLARIPFLVAYGVFLRNVSNIVYFDKIHGSTNWRLLDDEDTDIQLSECLTLPQPDENGDVGIALGLSTPILIKQLPIEFQKNTALINPIVKTQRNLILNQDNLQRVSSSLVEIIDTLSREPEVKKIHLFLSVQSSLAIEIGRKFQEGIHKAWVIHNYDGNSGQYTWAAEITKEGLKLLENKKIKGSYSK
jgi:hypothetical protein